MWVTVDGPHNVREGDVLLLDGPRSKWLVTNTSRRRFVCIPATRWQSVCFDLRRGWYAGVALARGGLNIIDRQIDRGFDWLRASLPPLR